MITPRRHDEQDYQHALHDALVAAGVTLWRNNVGVAAWKTGGRTRYGLGLGSADLVGLYRGRFVAVECKADGTQTPAQVAWQRAVEQAGGLYVLARAGVDRVEDVVRRVLAC